MADTVNMIEIEDMLRDIYRPQLQEELQQTHKSYEPFVTNVGGCTGERVEFNGVGKLKAGYRTEAFERKGDGQQLKFSKRWLMPIAIKSLAMYTKDHFLRKGSFPVSAETFIKQMRNEFARQYDLAVLGAKWSDELGYPVLPSITDPNPKSNYYNGGALNGLLNTNWTGESGTTPENFAIQPMLATGELATSWSDVTSIDDVDFATTSVVPVNYKDSGTLDEATGCSVEKILAALEMLETRMASTGDTMFNMAITPRQKYELMRSPYLNDEAKHGFTAIKNGFVSELLQVRFLVTNMVPVVNVGGGKLARLCPVWKSEDLYVGMWDDFKMKAIDRTNDDFWDRYDISGEMSIGAARGRKETVMGVLCADSRLKSA